MNTVMNVEVSPHSFPDHLHILECDVRSLMKLCLAIENHTRGPFLPLILVWTLPDQYPTLYGTQIEFHQFSQENTS